MTTKLFSELGLSPELLKAIDKLGFEQAAPIQAEAIPVLMAGRDVVGQSQTGSGKTLAFAAPAIEKTEVAVRAVQVMILCPTRELAVQVSEEVHKLALFKRGLHALPIYGGQSYDRQLYGLREGAHIVIGTPGRIMDHMRRGTLRLDKLKMVILDEVDVMLNMGFRDDIELILQSTPKERQTVFFSATIPRPIQQLIEKYSREPVQVRIEQKALTVPTVEQVYYEVDRRHKIELLTRLIDIHDLKLGIVFCNTKRMVDDLVDHLNAQGYSADRLHGDMTQMMRDRVMNKFRKSGLEFLVATDVAARGIDVDEVQVVFNYDLPYDAEDYVHRIGRTGRAGRSGRAISFVAGRELFQINLIERYTRTKIQRARIPSANEVEEARANAFLDKLRVTLKAGEFKRQEHLIGVLLEEGFNSTDIAAALLYHLQGGAEAPPASAPRGEDRPERPPYGEAREAREPRPRNHGSGRLDERPARPARPAVFSPPAKVKREAAPPEPKLPAPQPKAPAHQPPSTIATESTPPAPAGEPVPAEIPAVAVPASAPAAPAAPTASPKPRVSRREEVQAPFPERKPAFQKNPRREFRDAAPRTPFPVKESRRTPDEQTRLYMNVGAEMGIAPNDVVGAILGETGLPGKTVGKVDIRERHLFVDVASEHANAIISKLNRTRIKEHKLKVKVA